MKEAIGKAIRKKAKTGKTGSGSLLHGNTHMSVILCCLILLIIDFIRLIGPFVDLDRVVCNLYIGY